MIEISKKEYPYPVLALGRDDFSEDCSYSVKVNIDDIKVTAENIEIPVSYELKCNSLENEIRNRRFVPIIKVRSSAASFCRIYSFNQDNNKIVLTIPKYDVSEKIELTGLIVANEAIDSFCCPEMNKAYFGGMTFSLRKGDAIAIETTKTIYIDDSELEKPIVSIFTINYIEGQEESITADFSDEKININLNEELNKMYWSLKDYNNGALRRYVIAVIVTPALIEAIDIIRQHYLYDSGENYSEKRWFRAIELKAERKGYSLNNYMDSSAMLADILLGNIALDALKSFKDLFDREMNSGETQLIGGID